MRSLFSFLFMGMMVWLIISCEKETPPSADPPETLKYMELFKGQSPFWEKIPDTASVDPHSSVMVQSLIEQAQQAFLVAVKEWTVPVYYADAATPRHDVRLTASWAPKKTLKNVPIPDFARADPEDDGSLVIIDEDAGCAYDFWQARQRNGEWEASWGNAIPLASNGIFPKGFSARGSGFELLQGVIWPQELAQGYIPHALVFSYDHTRAGGPVPPATESDGTSTDAWAIPEGARVQLDPSLDLDSLGLTGYEKIIARALQEYGMFCADDGGGIQLYAINPICVKGNPYESIWGDRTYVFLQKIPVERFRVLTLPPQTSGEPEIVPNSCAVFE